MNRIQGWITCGLLLSAAGCKTTTKANWERFEDGKQSYSVEFPGKPVCKSENGNRLCLYSWGHLEFTGLTAPRIPGPPPSDVVPPGNTRVELGAHKGLRREVTDGDPLGFGHAVDVHTAKYWIHVDVMWKDGATPDDVKARYLTRTADADRFLNSLKILDAPL